jgi:hypothetical protein
METTKKRDMNTKKKEKDKKVSRFTSTKRNTYLLSQLATYNKYKWFLIHCSHSYFRLFFDILETIAKINKKKEK